MKIRKDYSVIILPFRDLAVLTRGNNAWVNWLQRNATCGCTIYDCNFEEAKHNLKILSKRGFYIQKRKGSKFYCS